MAKTVKPGDAANRISDYPVWCNYDARLICKSIDEILPQTVYQSSGFKTLVREAPGYHGSPRNAIKIGSFCAIILIMSSITEWKYEAFLNYGPSQTVSFYVRNWKEMQNW